MTNKELNFDCHAENMSNATKTWNDNKCKEQCEKCKIEYSDKTVIRKELTPEEFLHTNYFPDENLEDIEHIPNFTGDIVLKFMKEYAAKAVEEAYNKGYDDGARNAANKIMNNI